MISFKEYLIQESSIPMHKKYVALLDAVRQGKSKNGSIQLPNGFSVKVVSTPYAENGNKFGAESYLYKGSSKISSIYYEYEMGDYFGLSDVRNNDEYGYLNTFDYIDDLANKIKKGKR
jgi:hypothetical protein